MGQHSTSSTVGIQETLNLLVDTILSIFTPGAQLPGLTPAHMQKYKAATL